VVVLGLWLAIVGYGVAFAGVQKLAGGTCSIGQAFRNQCSAAQGQASGGPDFSLGVGGPSRWRHARAMQRRQVAQQAALHAVMWAS
jgi:hypothetical protein